MWPSSTRKDLEGLFCWPAFLAVTALNKEPPTFSLLRCFQSPRHLNNSQPWINDCSLQEETLPFYYTQVRLPKYKHMKCKWAEYRINLCLHSRYINIVDILESHSKKKNGAVKNAVWDLKQKSAILLYLILLFSESVSVISEKKSHGQFKTFTSNN